MTASPPLHQSALTRHDLAESWGLRLSQLPNGVRSLTVMQKGRAARALRDSRQNKSIEDSYVVTDLLNDLSYLVTPSNSHIQLLFALDEAFVAADVDMGTDPLEVADIIRKRFLEPGRSLK